MRKHARKAIIRHGQLLDLFDPAQVRSRRCFVPFHCDKQLCYAMANLCHVPYIPLFFLEDLVFLRPNKHAAAIILHILAKNIEGGVG